MDEHTPEVAPPLCDGRYRLREVLGEGGMAVVYRAWDSRLEVERAVKLLLPEMAARPRIRDRFHAEARTMARLNHPHIVSVHDVDADGDRVYIVMELIEGGTLWDRVVQLGPMPPRLAVDAVLPALSALALAHQRGVVHRDVKPQNVMITPDGVPKLTDFGIARIETEGVRTRTAAVMGTWTYMPPEQRNSARDTDARSDLYAVGAMLYALVRGCDPPDLFAADLDATLLDGVPPALAEVIRGATRYRREDRFDDADAMAAALAACRAALPELSPELAAAWPAPGSVAITTGGGAASIPPAASAWRSDPAATIPPPEEAAAVAAQRLPHDGAIGALSAGGGLSLAAPSVTAPAVATTQPPPAPLPPPPRVAAAATPTSIPPADGTFYVDGDEDVAPTRSRLPLVLGLLASGLVVVAVSIGLRGDDPPGPLDAGAEAATILAPTATSPPDAPSGDDQDAPQAGQAPTPAASSRAADPPATGTRADDVGPTSASGGSPPAGSSAAAPSSEASSAAAPSTAAPSSAAASTAAPSTAAAVGEAPAEATPAQTTGSASKADEAPGTDPDSQAADASTDPPVAEPAETADAASAGSGTTASDTTSSGTTASSTTASDTTTTRAEPAGSGAVAIAGNVDKVSLIDKTTGDSWGPGTVPAGDYWVHARFPGEDDARRVGQVRVMPDWEVVVRCHSGSKTCR